jgi:cation diffusion facilitator CzcD-associated flavoprotein CzcO
MSHVSTAEELVKRYAHERAKRLRPSGNDQYVEVPGDGHLARFIKDPNATGQTRPAARREVEVLILGAGMSGLMSAARLIERGITDLLVVEKGADVGGTWYWNRYPGVRCDVESHIYIPLIEELGRIPSEQYASGAEILEHCRRIAGEYDIYRRTLLETNVIEIKWNESARRWDTWTDRGDVLASRFLILGGGRQHRLRLPGIQGIERFQGHSFHTSRWDYEYTGGGTAGGLTKLRDKRVAIIGTGATGVQCVPYLAQDTSELLVVQRTPCAVDSRSNAPTDASWAAALGPGWQEERMANFEAFLRGDTPETMVNDQWGEIWGRQTTGESYETDAEVRSMLLDEDLRQMERIRTRIDSTVKDKRTAEALKPYYYRFCKRPTFNDDYLEAFNRPNVWLVDTDGRGVDEIVERGLVVAGRLYEVDCIIYATGQEFGAIPPRSGEFKLVGRDESLVKKWEDGVKSLHGILTHGFPNMFYVGGREQSANTVNGHFLIAKQASHVAEVVHTLLSRNVEVADLRLEAEEAWGRVIAERSPEDLQDCTPSIFNGEGSGRSFFTLVYGGSPFEYFSILEDWRRTDMNRDLEVSYGVEDVT